MVLSGGDIRVTSKGQVTIPIEIRQEFGFLPGAEVEFVIEDQAVRLVLVDSKRRGRSLVEHLRGGGTVKMTTDEIMALTRGEP